MAFVCSCWRAKSWAGEREEQRRRRDEGVHECGDEGGDASQTEALVGVIVCMKVSLTDFAVRLCVLPRGSGGCSSVHQWQR